MNLQCSVSFVEKDKDGNIVTENGEPKIIIIKDFIASLVLSVITDENKEAVEIAALSMADDEDKFLLTGEHAGWPALNQRGLSTIEGRLFTRTGEAFSAKSLDALISDAVRWLETNKHKGPYKLILNEKYRSHGYISNKAISAVRYSEHLYTKDGKDCDGLLLADYPENFIVIATDWNVKQLKDTKYAKVYGSFAVAIVNPTAICELQFNRRELVFSSRPEASKTLTVQSEKPA